MVESKCHLQKLSTQAQAVEEVIMIEIGEQEILISLCVWPQVVGTSDEFENVAHQLFAQMMGW